MTQKELEQKVIDAEGRVAKREAVLKKHNSQLAKMIEKGADRFDVSIKREDIKSATSKLAEARETLANWKDKHYFTNKTKTAAAWGVKVKAKLLRGSATETCYIQSIGGNFA